MASLLMTLEEMHLLSKKMFFNSLSLHASRLMDKVEYAEGCSEFQEEVTSEYLRD